MDVRVSTPSSISSVLFEDIELNSIASHNLPVGFIFRDHSALLFFWIGLGFPWICSIYNGL